ncbi:dCTP deaminase domain-containing protein [Nocardia sp. NPDC088792]|uniref:dCTP deaminase n=1 Tax=Nocardia sp. NPDC088792 TaxID=3364332 RepID=UPI003805E9E5
MILTGPQICSARERGQIVIEPFDPDAVNPNSYNFRLANTLHVYRCEVFDPRVEPDVDEITMPDDGYVLEANQLYLAASLEVMGGDYFVPTFTARSSVARAGLFINLSATLGDIGYLGQWTLQLFAAQRIRILPGMKIGQISWWQPVGEIDLYAGKYQYSHGPSATRIYRDFATV